MKIFYGCHNRQLPVIGLDFIQVLCCFHSPRHFAYRSWSLDCAHLLRVTISHARGTLTSLLLPLNFLRLLSQDAVVFASHTQHLCLSREPAQQQEHFFKQCRIAWLTVQSSLLMTQRSVSRCGVAIPKSTAWCDMPGEGQPTR